MRKPKPQKARSTAPSSARVAPPCARCGCLSVTYFLLMNLCAPCMDVVWRESIQMAVEVMGPPVVRPLAPMCPCQVCVARRGEVYHQLYMGLARAFTCQA
jgi:hypothetical protein